MKSAAQRLQALDADLARIKVDRAFQHKAIILKTISLIPPATMDRLREWRTLWMDQPVEIERKIAEVAVTGPDPMSALQYPALSQWTLAVVDTPDDELPPMPPHEARTQLEAMVAEWERAALEECAGQPDKHQAMLWLGGFCRYFACLAQVLESASP